MSHLVLTVLGPDRPGLTQALADAVLEAGGNWLESRLARLGGRYVGAVLVDLGEEAHGDLRAALGRRLPPDVEMRLVPAGSDPGAGPRLTLSLVGQDRPGIVRQVSRALAELRVNIEELETRVDREPHAGASLFHAEGVLRLPPGLEAGALQAALEEISGEVMVDISLSPPRNEG